MYQVTQYFQFKTTNTDFNYTLIFLKISVILNIFYYIIILSYTQVLIYLEKFYILLNVFYLYNSNIYTTIVNTR